MQQYQQQIVYSYKIGDTILYWIKHNGRRIPVIMDNDATYYISSKYRVLFARQINAAAIYRYQQRFALRALLHWDTAEDNGYVTRTEVSVMLDEKNQLRVPNCWADILFRDFQNSQELLSAMNNLQIQMTQWRTQ